MELKDIRIEWNVDDKKANYERQIYVAGDLGAKIKLIILNGKTENPVITSVFKLNENALIYSKEFEKTEAGDFLIPFPSEALKEKGQGIAQITVEDAEKKYTIPTLIRYTVLDLLQHNCDCAVAQSTVTVVVDLLSKIDIKIKEGQDFLKILELKINNLDSLINNANLKKEELEKLYKELSNNLETEKTKISELLELVTQQNNTTSQNLEEVKTYLDNLNVVTKKITLQITNVESLLSEADVKLNKLQEIDLKANNNLTELNAKIEEFKKFIENKKSEFDNNLEELVKKIELKQDKLTEKQLQDLNKIETLETELQTKARIEDITNLSTVIDAEKAKIEEIKNEQRTQNENISNNNNSIESLKNELLKKLDVDIYNNNNTEMQTKLNDIIERLSNNIVELAKKQDKLIAGNGITITDNTISTSINLVSKEEVEQLIAKAELDDITLKDVEDNLLKPVNAKLKELSDKNVELQNNINTKLNEEQVNALLDVVKRNLELQLNTKLTQEQAKSLINQMKQNLQYQIDTKANKTDLNILERQAKMVYFKGQTIYFRTLTEAREWATENHLVENTDIAFNTEDRFLKLGSGSYSGGSYTITESNIQAFSKNLSFTTSTQNGTIVIQSRTVWTKDGKMIFLQEMGAGGYVSLTSRNDTTRNFDWSSDPGFNGNQSGDENTEFTYSLNHSHSVNTSFTVGSSSPQPFKPAYRERCEVIFLKNTIIKMEV